MYSAPAALSRLKSPGCSPEGKAGPSDRVTAVSNKPFSPTSSATGLQVSGRGLQQDRAVPVSG